MQKLQFLELELKETKEQLNDVKKAHSSTLHALEMSNFDSQHKSESSKTMLELKETHIRELRQIEQQFEGK